jgi:hypothetical protein
MELTLLTVPDCPNAAAFEERLAAALSGWTGPGRSSCTATIRSPPVAPPRLVPRTPRLTAACSILSTRRRSMPLQWCGGRTVTLRSVAPGTDGP